MTVTRYRKVRKVVQWRLHAPLRGPVWGHSQLGGRVQGWPPLWCSFDPPCSGSSGL